MSTMEERMSFLEATLLKQGEAHAALREDFARFETRVDSRFAQLESHMDARFNAVDGRFTLIESKFTQFEDRFTRLEARVDTRFTTLNDKVSRQFVWLVGLQMTTLIAVVGGLVGIVGTLLARG